MRKIVLIFCFINLLCFNLFADDVVVTKSDAYSITATVQKPLPPPEIQNYDYGFLLAQRIRIANDTANMQLELDKVDFLISEAEKRGVVSKPIETPQIPK